MESNFKEIYQKCNDKLQNEIDKLLLTNMELKKLYDINESVENNESLDKENIEDNYNIFIIYYYIFRMKIKEKNFLKKLEENYGIVLDVDSFMKEINGKIQNIENIYDFFTLNQKIFSKDLTEIILLLKAPRVNNSRKSQKDKFKRIEIDIFPIGYFIGENVHVHNNTNFTNIYSNSINNNSNVIMNVNSTSSTDDSKIIPNDNENKEDNEDKKNDENNENIEDKKLERELIINKGLRGILSEDDDLRKKAEAVLGPNKLRKILLHLYFGNTQINKLLLMEAIITEAYYDYKGKLKKRKLSFNEVKKDFDESEDNNKVNIHNFIHKEKRIYYNKNTKRYNNGFKYNHRQLNQPKK